MELLARPEKDVAGSDHHCDDRHCGPIDLGSRIRPSALHLRAILIYEGLGHFRLISRFSRVPPS